MGVGLYEATILSDRNRFGKFGNIPWMLFLLRGGQIDFKIEERILIRHEHKVWNV